MGSAHLSLINKMLQDLEARRHMPAAGARPLYEDLRPATSEPARDRSALYFLLGGSLVFIAGVFGLMQWRSHSTSTAPLATAAVHTAMPTASVPEMAAATTSNMSSARLGQGSTGARRDHAIALRPLATRRVTMQRDRLAQHGHANHERQLTKHPGAVIAANPARPMAQTMTPAMADGGKPAGNSQIAREEIPLTAAQIAENRYRDGARLLEQGQRAEAEAALQSALASDAKHEKARELLAGLLLEDGNWPEAEQLLRQGLKVLPHETAFSYLLARVEVERGDAPKAIRLLERDLPDASADPDYLALLATLYQRAGRNADAIRTFSKALALRPLAGKWWLGIAISFEAAKDWSDAREAYTRAKLSNLNPDLTKYADERLQAIQFK